MVPFCSISAPLQLTARSVPPRMTSHLRSLLGRRREDEDIPAKVLDKISQTADRIAAYSSAHLEADSCYDLGMKFEDLEISPEGTYRTQPPSPVYFEPRGVSQIPLPHLTHRETQTELKSMTDRWGKPSASGMPSSLSNEAHSLWYYVRRQFRTFRRDTASDKSLMVDSEWLPRGNIIPEIIAEDFDGTVFTYGGGPAAAWKDSSNANRPHIMVAIVLTSQPDDRLFKLEVAGI